MTRKMLLALSAASVADTHGGLAYTVAGYACDHAPTEYHNFGSIGALVNRGYLSIEGKGRRRRALVTESGRNALKLEQHRNRAEGQS